MTVEEWIEQTNAATLIFEPVLGDDLREAAIAANPSWKYLTDYGRKVWLCQFCNPIKAK